MPMDSKSIPHKPPMEKEHLAYLPFNLLSLYNIFRFSFNMLCLYFADGDQLLTAESGVLSVLYSKVNFTERYFFAP